MEVLNTSLEFAVELGIQIFSWIGVIILAIAGIMGVADHIRRRPDGRLRLLRGMSLSLSFLMGGEILHTVVVRDLMGIAIIGGTIVLRVALTLVIHWEMKHAGHTEEKPREDEEDERFSMSR